MYVITFIDNGALESVSTPSFARAITIADALWFAGFAVRLWRNNRLV